MASVALVQGRHQAWNGGIDFLTEVFKAILMKSAYAPAVTADGITTASEIVATGYTGAFGGAGRKTLASKAVNRDDANTRVELDCADITWTAIGGATNDTIGGVKVAKEVTNDVSSIALAFDDSNDVTTNGGDVTWSPNAEGFLQT